MNKKRKVSFETPTLKKFFKYHNITSTELAKVLNVSRYTVINKFKGVSCWTINDLIAINQHYHFQIEAMLHCILKDYYLGDILKTVEE